MTIKMQTQTDYVKAIAELAAAMPSRVLCNCMNLHCF